MNVPQKICLIPNLAVNKNSLFDVGGINYHIKWNIKN